MISLRSNSFLKYVKYASIFLFIYREGILGVKIFKIRYLIVLDTKNPELVRYYVGINQSIN